MIFKFKVKLNYILPDASDFDDDIRNLRSEVEVWSFKDREEVLREGNLCENINVI